MGFKQHINLIDEKIVLQGCRKLSCECWNFLKNNYWGMQFDVHFVQSVIPDLQSFLFANVKDCIQGFLLQNLTFNSLSNFL